MNENDCAFISQSQTPVLSCCTYQHDKWPCYRSIPDKSMLSHKRWSWIMLRIVFPPEEWRRGSMNTPHIWKPTLSKRAHLGHSFKIIGHIRTWKNPRLLFPSLSSELILLAFNLQIQSKFNCTHLDSIFARGMSELTLPDFLCCVTQANGFFFYKSTQSVKST